ncbi:MAG TPA: undecaprenyl-phosphate glucose phosphotransferase [Gammaproteobacteria bacterium]|nr:undecaprenyl-phosphate glucose phosphotransferase [Gammaproteobacteria bacterium]
MLPKGLLKEYSRMLSIIIRFLDMLVVMLAGVLAYAYKFESVSIPFFYCQAMLVGGLVAPFVLNAFSIYSSVRSKGFFTHCFNLAQAMLVLALLLAGIAFLTKSGELYSRAWYGFWMLGAYGLLVLYRGSLIILLRTMRAHGMNERRVVIMGAGALGVKFAESVQQALWTGFRIVAFIDDNAEAKPAFIHNIPVLKTPTDLSAFMKEKRADEVWLALPLRAEARVKEMIYALRHETISMRFVLDIFGLDLLNHRIADVAGFPVLDIRTTPMVGINRLVKAVEDRVVAALILLVISPLLLLIALGVKLSSRGPVFFKQKRLGWDGRVINVYKFRTMVVHAEAAGQVTQASAHDPRVTPFGRFLRRTSLDELPQFFNVLQGRMSIVGPRPHALSHNEQYKEVVDTYMQRHRVKPGITGWAQVNGWRGETDTLHKMQKRVEYDLYYINNWSLRFDLKIIVLTFFRGFVNRNAY